MNIPKQTGSKIKSVSEFKKYIKNIIFPFVLKGVYCAVQHIFPVYKYKSTAA